MSWDTIFAGVLVLTCTIFGMLLGAWVASRGFEKALVKTMKEYNEKEK